MAEINVVWQDRKRTLFGLPWSFTKYSLTEEKLLVETDVTLKRSFGERIFGLGTIHCCSADRSTPEFDILRIKRSGEIKNMLSDMIEQQRTLKRVTSREFMSDQDDIDCEDDCN